MNTDQGNEWHPWLKMFTIFAIPAGLLLAGSSSCGAFGSGRPEDVLGGIFMLIVSVGGIFAAIRTLKVTDYFRRWSTVSGSDKLMAYWAIYLGICLFIALFFVAPFTRFLTDAVGGGLGVSNRS